MAKKIIFVLVFACCVTGCKTIDLERDNSNEEIIEKEKNNKPNYSFVKKLNEIENDDEISDEEYLTEELIKESDVSSAVIYLEPPQITYSDNPQESAAKMYGEEALKQNLKDITVLPEYTQGHLKGWCYKEGQIYQIHTQTYHSTIIQLQPGEELLQVPYISEPDVWRISDGIGIKKGLNTQFIMIKPDYSGLCSTLILITNQRVYQMELKSYKDHYMPYVKWIYPESINETFAPHINNNATSELKYEFQATNMENISFDYKIRRATKRPIWCPTLVYDDGKFTYIVLDKTTLHSEMPTIFIDKKKIVNTQIHENIIVINQLITKATLRLGKEKVTIIKKK